MLLSDVQKYNPKKPLQDNHYLIRYFSYNKFIKLINSKKLYLNRVDLFEDKFEGRLYELNHLRLMDSLEGKRYKENFKKFPNLSYQNYFISCWTHSGSESFAMWKIYCPEGKGIAIKTNVKKLKTYLTSKNVNYTLDYVKYLDFLYFNGTQFHLNDENTDKRFFFKDKHFEYEKEVRVIINKEKNPTIEFFEDKNILKGILVPFDINELIREIILSPDWEEKDITELKEQMKLNNIDLEKIKINKSKYNINNYYDSETNEYFPNGKDSE